MDTCTIDLFALSLKHPWSLVQLARYQPLDLDPMDAYPFSFETKDDV
jgi:hypothetical protein